MYDIIRNVEDGDEFSMLIVRRPRLETDEEVQARIKHNKQILLALKKRRFETYKIFKKEFDAITEDEIKQLDATNIMHAHSLSIDEPDYENNN